MIICKAPLRISIGGGGTDLPAYYQGVGTVFSSLAINKYVSVCITERFSNSIFLRYSENETVTNIKDIKHDIIRSVLIRNTIVSGFEIASFSDVPSGTGLGSSGAFTVALCAAVKTYLKDSFDKHSLAELATQIEMIDLNRPIGLQDQYATSFGGFSEFTVSEFGAVQAKNLILKSRALDIIKNNLLLYHVGGVRDSSTILKSDRDKMLKHKDGSQINQFDKVVEMGSQMTNALSQGDLDTYGELLNDYWLIKSKRQGKLTENIVHDIYNLGLNNGAIGGKLVGAGGNGFILFATKDPDRLRIAMSKSNVKELRFDICEKGIQKVSV